MICRRTKHYAWPQQRQRYTVSDQTISELGSIIRVVCWIARDELLSHNLGVRKNFFKVLRNHWLRTWEVFNLIFFLHQQKHFKKKNSWWGERPLITLPVVVELSSIFSSCTCFPTMTLFKVKTDPRLLLAHCVAKHICVAHCVAHITAGDRCCLKKTFNKKCRGWKRFYWIADDIGKWFSFKNHCWRL